MAQEREAAGSVTEFEHACLIRGDGGAAVRRVLDSIANKWTMLVVATLDAGTLRFSELRAHIPGVSQRMLTLTLKNLQRDGLVSRTAYAEVPPRVEYALTDLGRSLIGPSLALAAWAVEHGPAIEARRATDEMPRTAPDSRAPLAP
jgi:DNA-binding HxlR family transcriptional regulator